MRHRVARRHFNRDSKHRQALIMNLVRGLVEHGEVVTTKAKAKEVKRQTDKIVSRAKRGDITARRLLHRFFGKRDVVNTLVDRVAPVFKDRASGFTTHVVLGKRRGDNTEIVKVSFVEDYDRKGSLKAETGNKEKKAAVKKTAKKTPAKKAEVKKASKPATEAGAKVDAKVSSKTSSQKVSKKTTSRTTNK